jgi:hypothetical protein
MINIINKKYNYIHTFYYNKSNYLSNIIIILNFLLRHIPRIPIFRTRNIIKFILHVNLQLNNFIKIQ